MASKKSTIENMKQEAARDIETLKPTDTERALGSYDAIVAARTVERDAMLKQVATSPQPETPAILPERFPPKTRTQAGSFPARSALIATAGGRPVS